MATRYNQHSCADCGLKHLASAGTIAREILNGYDTPEYAFYLLGNLNEAEEQLVQFDPLSANAIRQLRKALLPSGLKTDITRQRLDYLFEIARWVDIKIQKGFYRQRPCRCNPSDIDIIIPLRAGGSVSGDRELRLALRSIDKNLRGFRKIYIASRQLPPWVTGVEFVKTEDIFPRKQMNIHYAIRSMLKTPGIAGEVIFWADDNVLLRECHVRDLPLAGRRDDLLGFSNAPEARVWHRSLKNTGLLLAQANRATTNFEAHTPIVFNREKYLALEQNFDFYNDVGLCYISLYCNFYNLQPTGHMSQYKATFESEKVSEDALTGKLFAGYCDTGAKAGALPMLEKRFPEPSRFEI